MELVSVHFDSPDDFLLAYSETNASPSVFYQTRRDDLTTGQTVIAEIDFPGLPNHALVRGVVGDITFGRGVTIWLSKEDAQAISFAVGIARGEIEIKQTYPRSHSRIPATLPIDCRIEGERPMWVSSETEDLSAGGVFIRAREIPELGSRVRLVIGPTRTGDRFLVYGKVAWTRPGGFGVRFSSRGHSDSRKLRTVIRRSAETGKVAFAS